MQFVLKNFKREMLVQRLANIHYFQFTPSLHTADDSHDFCELVYVDSGKISITSERYTGELSEHCMIIHSANEVHSLTSSEDAPPDVIIIGFECTSPKISELASAPLYLTDELQKMLAEIIKEARGVYLPPYDIPNVRDMKKRKKFAFGADQLIKNYLQIFLIKAVRLSDDGKRESDATIKSGAVLTQIGEIQKYIDENFKERISLEELCFLFNTNKTTLSKDFKAVFGKTVIDYVNCLRIDYTKKKLSEGEVTLTEIAERLNISSVHYLTTLFKKYEGTTPTAYLASVKRIQKHPT